MSITIDGKIINGINIDKKEVIKIQDAKTLNILWGKSKIITNDYLYVKNEYNGDNVVTITEYVSGGSYSSNINNYWSKDNGQTWNSFKFDDQNVKTKTFTLKNGEYIHFKSPKEMWNNYKSSSSISYYRTITCSQTFSVGGNIKSVCMYDYPNLVCNYGFVGLFKDSTNLVDASKLDLSNLKVGDYCFKNLFSGCTSLINPPILKLQTLKTGCYQQIFDGCTSLNEITTYANDISATDCIYRWLRNVASSGTFRNLGSATYIKNSESGIPTGWQVVTE